MTFFTVLVVITLYVVLKTFVIVPNHQTYVKERLGKFQKVLEPGFHFMIPILDRLAYQHEICLLYTSLSPRD